MENENNKFCLICTIVNRGYSDDVMDAARDAGARGGTIMYAHGAGIPDEDSFFGISIHPEKEMVLIVSKNEEKDEIMKAIVKKVGLFSEGAGITFSLPVDNIGGIARLNNPESE